MLKKLKSQDTPVGHMRIFNQTAIIDLLKQEGFSIVSTKGAEFYSLPKAIRLMDRLLSVYPRLSSNLIVLAKKN